MPPSKGNAPDLSHVRNIGIAAHIDAGKTTLTERILYYTGASHKIGEVHDGEAHMDYLAEEQAHGITIMAAVTQCPWKNHVIQVVDTPGHVDFTIEVERSMRVLDGAVIVLDGVRGVEPQTETVWRQATRFDLPLMFFVNKMDRPGADFGRSMESVQKRLGGEPVPVCVPVGDEVVHLVDKEVYRFEGERGEQLQVRPCEPELWEEVAEFREAMLLAAADLDDDIAEIVLEDGEPEPEALWAALRKGTLERKIHPFLGGTALKNQGVQPLLDSVLKLLPSPTQRPQASGTDMEGNPVPVSMDAKGPLAALAFKVQLIDGRRHVFVRLYRGSLHPGDNVLLAGTGETERVARIFDIDANKKKRIEAAYAGQIVLLAGMRKATTGDTICQVDEPVLLESIQTRDPVLGLAIETDSTQDEKKLLEVLQKFQEEDPTLVLEEDPETGQRILRGMGELHLQIAFERLEREFKLKIRAGKPAVVVRESILGTGQGSSEFHRVFEQEEARIEMRANATAQVESLPRDTGIEFVLSPTIEPDGAQLKADQLQSIEDGARDAATSGPLQGAQLQDLKIQVQKVETFGPASSPQAIRVAVAEAVRKAIASAGSTLLQPVMATEVVVPEESLGGVLGDLQARGALIHDTRTELGTASITCDAPLQKLLGYTTDLRSMTRGRGQFTMTFDRFDAV